MRRLWFARLDVDLAKFRSLPRALAVFVTSNGFPKSYRSKSQNAYAEVALDGNTPSVVFRGFSGHWMAFYLAATSTLYSVIVVSRADVVRRCPDGHPASPSANFCDVRVRRESSRSFPSREGRVPGTAPRWRPRQTRRRDVAEHRCGDWLPSLLRVSGASLPRPRQNYNNSRCCWSGDRPEWQSAAPGQDRKGAAHRWFFASANVNAPATTGAFSCAATRIRRNIASADASNKVSADGASTMISGKHESKLRSIEPNDYLDWETFARKPRPGLWNDCGWFTLSIGPEGEPGTDLFQVHVSTPNAASRAM